MTARSLCALCALAVLLLAGDAAAQAKWNVLRFVAASGGVTMRGAKNTVTGTVGQPAVGPAGSESNAVFAGFWYTPARIPVDVEQAPSGRAFTRLDAYPNPLRDRATVSFALRASADVSITLYDVLGRAVASAGPPAHYAPGDHVAAFETSMLPAGMYVLRLVAGSDVLTRSVIIRR